jgi:hypothetical protein
MICAVSCAIVSALVIRSRFVLLGHLRLVVGRGRLQACGGLIDDFLLLLVGLGLADRGLCRLGRRRGVSLVLFARQLLLSLGLDIVLAPLDLSLVRRLLG